MKAKNKPAEGVNSAEVLKKLLARIAKYRLLLVLSIILAAATVVLQLYVPILFGDAIDEIVAAHAVRFDAMWAYLRRILVEQTEQLANTAFTDADALRMAQEQQISNNQLKYTIIIVSSLPMLIAYPFFQNYFVKGVMLGSLKE